MLHAVVRAGFLLSLAAGAAQALPWPGGTPVDVTPAPFGNNVSGAAWNPFTQSLWTVENSPGIVRRSTWDNAMSQWVVAQSWQPGSDIEAIAFRLFEDGSVFVGIERDANNHRLIREYNTSTFALLREWDLVAMRFGPANDGLEALAFVPDSILAAMQFEDSNGVPYVSSQYGSGGLFFAGHQDNGQIYVFDLDRTTAGTNRPHVHVTTIVTGQSEIAALEFDRSNGLLYAWHDDAIDKLQVLAADGGGHFAGIALFDNPFCCDWNIEGITFVDRDNCAGGTRSILFTRDQALVTDPSLYEDDDFPCDCNGNAVADAIDIAATTSQDLNANGVPDECEEMATDVSPGAAQARAILHPNVPNPFNPQTTVVFELQRTEHVTLTIYDIAGRHVQTLLDETAAAGNHTHRWTGTDRDGHAVPSGVYFCRLQTATTMQSRRLVCLR